MSQVCKKYQDKFLQVFWIAEGQEDKGRPESFGKGKAN